MTTIRLDTGILGAPDNHEHAKQLFADLGNPIEIQAKGMSRYRLEDGSHIVCTYRAIYHTTRKATSPLTSLGGKPWEAS